MVYGKDATIRDVQMVQLGILIEIDRLCKEHNIKYQLFAGSLLGAIRHNGFIPWDDDIDICLLRKDYNKLMDICRTKLSAKYFLQTYNTDKNYNMQFAKIRKNNTVFIEKSLSGCKIHHGVFIDIFPLDNIAPNLIKGKIQQKYLNFIYRVNSKRKRTSIHNNSKFKKYAGMISYYLLKLVPKRLTDEAQIKLMCIFSNNDTKYVTHLSNGATKSAYNRYMMNKDQFYDTINWEFEGHYFPVPRNYDEVLTNLFGDYMTPPPKDQQKPHHGIIEIVLGTENQINSEGV